MTIAGNFWPRPSANGRYPVTAELYRTEPDVQVLVHEQRPSGDPVGHVILVHGLEGSSDGGYMRSLAFAALESGFAAHRFNLRSCGGTEALCPTAYHSGLTSDLLSVLRQVARESRGPLYLVGFSLGGNIALKLAGELGEAARPLLAGVCAVSTPIDLAACVDRLEQPQNRIYELRFLRKLKERIRVRHRLNPERFPLAGLKAVRKLHEFDDRFTAPGFGFRDAAEYYATQSSKHFLRRIRVPTLLIQAKDDPVIPFSIFEDPAVHENPYIELIAPEHGGHLGFLARGRPRFWADEVVMDWILGNKTVPTIVSSL